MGDIFLIVSEQNAKMLAGDQKLNFSSVQTLSLVVFDVCWKAKPSVVSHGQ